MILGCWQRRPHAGPRLGDVYDGHHDDSGLDHRWPVATGDATTDDAGSALVAAGDALRHAIVSHSDHLELSEQVDGATGFQKRARNLTWSVAAFLSATRSRADVIGR